MKSCQPVAALSSDPEERLDTAAKPLHNANNQSLPMSVSGPSECSGISPGRGRERGRSDEGDRERSRSPTTMSKPITPTHVSQHNAAMAGSESWAGHAETAPVELRAHFEDFAAELRLQRHNEYKRRMLQHRRHHLQKAVALSGRLQRLSSWVHDGLVEISRNDDSTTPSSFVRVQQHLQDLSDVCISQWNHEIQALDPVTSSETHDPRSGPASFLDKLSSDSQRDCLDFLHNIRSSPRYLIDRFKAVSTAQLSALSTSPRYQNLPSSILASLSQNSGRSSQRRQRIHSYSKTLEFYATSFERKNAFTFLLYNCFGSDEVENTLRISTWASICAGLFQESRPAFDAIIHQVLSGFVPLGRWPARDRLHLFLMDVLQRGAFLTESPDGNRSASSLQSTISDEIETDETRDFFDDVVAQLFHILLFHGGIPVKALELARAIEGKLDDPASQNEFRTVFFFDWFLRYFLKITLNCPENEKMLLQYRVSSAARRRILVPLHQKADIAACDALLPGPGRSSKERVRYCVENLIGQISETQVQSPYETPVFSDESKTIKPYGFQCLSSLTICADEIIHVLDALSQQYNDPILSSSHSAFSSQYPTANNGFRRLRHELLMLQEPGSSSTSGHPCQENWVVLPILEDGRPDRPSHFMMHGKTSVDLAENWSRRLGDIDGAQRAAARLVFEAPVADGVTVLGLSQRASDRKSLMECFDERAKIAFDAADNVDAQYWYAALDLLQERYPTARWGQDDSRVLRPLLQHLRTGDVDSLAHIQPQISRLEDAYSDSKRSLLAASKRLHLLKVRLWYETGVINSNPYEEAKNIARALNYMALSPNVVPESTHSASSDRMRPGTSTSTTSSMFEQTRVDTMNIMKAPIEHGGSRKLADLQVEMTKKWLDRNSIENFCKGEERIHRFCMEIKMATRKLVGETYAESPVLWTSDLWTKEKLGYEIGATAALSVHGSTRPPSVMSETYSTTNFSARPLLSSLGFSARSFDVDIASSQGRKSSFYSLGSHRLSRDIVGSDYAASFSPGQSLTATSGESVSSLWSPMPSQSRSATSASMPSRTPSISNEFAGPRFSESSVEKTKFLDDLQHDLTTLLLSDLGNPVWCQGSETDTWLVTASRNPNITRRLERQQQISQLLPPRTTAPKQTLKQPKEKRRTWSADTLRRDDCAVVNSNQQETKAAKVHGLPNELMMGELQDILQRISDHIDPRMKLDAVHEFKVLAMQAYPKPQTARPMQITRPSNKSRPRGSSLGPGSTTQRTPEKYEWRLPESQSEITEFLKIVLLALQHQTLFRDLQYIAAFISADILNKTEKGRAFLHVGLGALACKDEYCRTMVDLADKIVAKDGIKRRLAESDGMEEGLKEAKEYWKLAAREGNRIAQRELASLYLAHPEVLPIISLPMSLSSEVFKTEMRWDERTGDTTNTQALCLALHWMQQAAENGDQVALQRLEERKESSSLR